MSLWAGQWQTSVRLSINRCRRVCRHSASKIFVKNTRQRNRGLTWIKPSGRRNPWIGGQMAHKMKMLFLVVLSKIEISTTILMQWQSKKKSEEARLINDSETGPKLRLKQGEYLLKTDLQTEYRTFWKSHTREFMIRSNSKRSTHATGFQKLTTSMSSVKRQSSKTITPPSFHTWPRSSNVASRWWTHASIPNKSTGASSQLDSIVSRFLGRRRSPKQQS